MFRTVRPTPGWLVFLIIFTFVLVFAFLKRQDYDAQRLFFGSHTISHAEPHHPPMASSGDYSSVAPDRVHDTVPSLSSSGAAYLSSANLYSPSDVPTASPGAQGVSSSPASPGSDLSSTPVNGVPNVGSHPATRPAQKEESVAPTQAQSRSAIPTLGVAHNNSGPAVATGAKAGISSAPADQSANPTDAGQSNASASQESASPASASATASAAASASPNADESSATPADASQTASASPASTAPSAASPVKVPTSGSEGHPIDKLIEEAGVAFDELNNKKTSGVEQAAEAYRERRGRHPPPRFDKWVAFAEERDAIMIEELFDQIYHDLEPFWGVQARQLHEDSAEWPYVISIRNGMATTRMQADEQPTYISEWHNMLQLIETELPDVDLALNPEEVARVFVHWDKMGEYLDTANSLKPLDLGSASGITQEFSPLDPISGVVPPPLAGEWAEDKHTRWWLARHTCPPDSGARGIEVDDDLTEPPKFIHGYPNATYEGYVANWTMAKSICEHPHLRNLHGSWIAPTSHHVRRTLFPLFGSSKVSSVNNDILLPAATYWVEDEKWEENAQGWENKEESVFWRGIASGGDHNESNWKHFHRHRLVAMMNSTAVGLAEKNKEQPIFYLPDNSTLWPLSALATDPSAFGNWIDDFSDVGFNHLMCYPRTETLLGDGATCDYLDDYFHVVKNVEMEDYYNAKYLIDVDAEAYSVRWRKLLRSDSLPIKATIFSEWHDSRLIAWKHFVPMDMTYMDLWGILEYFMGHPEVAGTAEGTDDGDSALERVPAKPAHEEEAKTIAEAGREWANQVLRKEDMLIYMYRLILEYARICDEARDKMGYVGDLQ